MVHALERARDRLRPGGVLVSIHPHLSKRPFVAVIAAPSRRPVAQLVSPVFKPLLGAAVASIQAVVDAGLFTPIGRSDHRFRVRLASQAELERYLHLSPRPPRFPPGGRRRLRERWRNRPPGAEIEVSEH